VFWSIGSAEREKEAAAKAKILKLSLKAHAVKLTDEEV
jgi:hypothetical protein